MTFITTNDSLYALCQDLKTEQFITVDTEFLRDKTYFPQLCLVQIASSKGAFAIDPLAPSIDLSPLFEVMAAEQVLKVFHSARQDIEILLGLSGEVPSPLFDTQVAAMVCGFGEAASYETLVTKLVGHSIDKSCRFTDWSQRPLTEQQYHYALADVIHLRKVYESLAAMLQQTGRLSWLTEEMAALTNPDNYRTLPDDAWKKIKIKSNSPKFIRLVQELARWRELIAQEQNIPRNHLLKEPLLLEIAAIAPKTVNELTRIRNIGGVVLQPKLAQEVVDIIAKVKYAGVFLPPIEDTKPTPPGNGPLVDLLKVLLKTVSLHHQVAEKLIASSQDLSVIAYARTSEELREVRAMQGWRYELFGQLAEQLRAGKIALSAENDKMRIVPLYAMKEKELIG